jgi:hypothetical protein
MIYTIYPKFDATIYEKTESLNTGIDQILELSHELVGSSSKYNSRIVMKFDVSDIESRVNSGKISQNAKYYLQLRTADVREIPQEYTVYAHPISGSWVNGTGKYFNTPITTDGVSWTYRSSKQIGRTWGVTAVTGGINYEWDEISDSWVDADLIFGALFASVTGSYFSNVGGGTWWTFENTTCTQSFSYESSDIYMDVSSIVKKWITGSGRFENDGFILKFSNELESSNETIHSLKFFSTDSNTIYVPRLQVVWDDSVFTTGSLSPVSLEDVVIGVDLKKSYTEAEKAKIRIDAYTRYPQKTYTTQSYYTQKYYLPTSSYYEIRDASTDEIIIPFDTTGTKISCDSEGNYFNLWMNSFQPERFYRVLMRVDTSGGDVSQIFDNNYYFKVSR